MAAERPAAGSLGPRLAGRLTADLISRSPQYMNTIKYYEIDLRGRHHRALLQQAAVMFSMLTAIYASREQDRSHRKFGRDTGDSRHSSGSAQQQLRQ